ADVAVFKAGAELALHDRGSHGQRSRAIIGVYQFQHLPAAQFLRRVAEDAFTSRTGVDEMPVRVDDPDARGCRIPDAGGAGKKYCSREVPFDALRRSPASGSIVARLTPAWQCAMSIFANASRGCRKSRARPSPFPRTMGGAAPVMDA